MTAAVRWWRRRQIARRERAMWNAVAFAYVYGGDGAAEWAMERLGLTGGDRR